MTHASKSKRRSRAAIGRACVTPAQAGVHSARQRGSSLRAKPTIFTHPPKNKRHSCAANGCACRRALAGAHRVGRVKAATQRLVIFSGSTQTSLDSRFRGNDTKMAAASARRWWPALALAWLIPSLALAQATSPASAPAGPSLGPMLLALLLVLALIPIALWLLKRMGPMANTPVAGLKIIAQLPLGSRERVVVLEAGDRWLLLGVTAAQIQRIGSLPKGELPAAAPSFKSLLQRARS